VDNRQDRNSFPRLKNWTSRTSETRRLPGKRPWSEERYFAYFCPAYKFLALFHIIVHILLILNLSFLILCGCG